MTAENTQHSPLDDARIRELVAQHDPDLARRLAEQDLRDQRKAQKSEFVEATAALRDLTVALTARTEEDREWRSEYQTAHQAAIAADTARHKSEMESERASKRVDLVTAIRDVMRGPAGIVIGGLASALGVGFIVLCIAFLATRLGDLGVRLEGAGMSLDIGQRVVVVVPAPAPVEPAKINSAAAEDDIKTSAQPDVTAPQPE